MLSLVCVREANFISVLNAAAESILVDGAKCSLNTRTNASSTKSERESERARKKVQGKESARGKDRERERAVIVS